MLAVVTSAKANSPTRLRCQSRILSHWRHHEIDVYTNIHASDGPETASGPDGPECGDDPTCWLIVVRLPDWKGAELGWIHSPVNSQVNRRSRGVLRWVEVGWMGHLPVNSQVKQRFHYVLKWVGWPFACEFTGNWKVLLCFEVGWMGHSPVNAQVNHNFCWLHKSSHKQ